ncbi:MAG: response regulator [marine benthic group bacterium]|nr:response regulator [Gemmatimonadota bacterium]
MARDPPRIAVVDDESGVRNGLTRLLRSAGFDSDAYAGGAEFLDDLATARPDGLILDLRMPEMDGFELLDRLADSGRDIPVVILTSFPSAETRHRALRAGVVAFLEKPAERAALLEALDRALSIGLRTEPPSDRDDFDPESMREESIP